MNSAWRSYSSAPDEGALVCLARDIPVKGTRCVSVSSPSGSFPILIVRDEFGVCGYVNACPHQYLPLNYRSDDVLSSDGQKLVCSAHGALFDVRTGTCLSADAAEGLDPVPLVEDAQGNLRIRSYR